MTPKTCKSLSGRSTLSYVIEGDTLRIVGNSGGGLFSPEPVSLDVLREATKTRDLRRHFVGRSLNTAGFVLAAYRDHQWSQPDEAV